jgi:DNA (cytosine-5)-methyltransferase 1
MTVGSACAGYEGLGMGLAQVLDIEHRWFAEYEPPTPKHPKPAQAAARLLAHRFPGVPNHGDLTRFDWSTAEPVDIFTAGWPCQPWSVAGKQLGEDDDRAIWPAIAAAIRILRPRYVFLENVPRVVVCGELARVLSDLAALGFDVAWTVLPASGVEAPHKRERLFIVAAHPQNLGCSRTRGTRDGRPGLADSGTSLTDTNRIPFGRPGATVTEGGVSADGIRTSELGRRGSPVADTDSAGLEVWPVEPDGSEHSSTERDCGESVADSACDGRGERRTEPARQFRGSDVAFGGDVVYWARYEPAIRRWETILGRPAPAPTVLGARGGQQLNARFVEFLMGLPEGWVTDVPGLTRNQQLKLLGNGVVPQQAAAAIRHLLPLLTPAEVAE